ncbi:unnamed protein product [Paramecium sonneborni]|uniref:Uncharacterized protein n=1 Tax=Paramecium sonneborni TaxID=65129 RepID=A0A8S1PEC9_9CILI|nr:unnamed protein product [Paramecium sonneborni]
MNSIEQRINEYLEQIELQITDPTQKQQSYFENVRHHIKSYEHKCQNEPEAMSPFSLREICSPIEQIKTCYSKSDELLRLNPFHRNNLHIIIHCKKQMAQI